MKIGTGTRTNCTSTAFSDVPTGSTVVVESRKPSRHTALYIGTVTFYILHFTFYLMNNCFISTGRNVLKLIKSLQLYRYI